MTPIDVKRNYRKVDACYTFSYDNQRTELGAVSHPFIGFDSAASIRLPEIPFEIARDLFAFRCDSDVGQYAAVKAGFGVGFCQVGMAKRDGLIPVLVDDLGFELDVWLVMHKDIKTSRRVRLLFDHLAAHLKAYLA
jgi:DNA-binding transcriptional LysR family regulator